MHVGTFYTIGVYGLTSDQYFQKLIQNNIDAFVDIRQRRAVRGSKYSFVNSIKLQSKLSELGIKYFHILELAPTTEIRELQKNDDLKKGIKKIEREELGQVFKDEYKRKILDKFDLSKMMDLLEANNVQSPVLFCVEKLAKACHRSLVAEQIQKDYSLSILNL
ncbi:MAG: hypothetical protein JWR18_1386 [Segetibacter sp.]|jgi:uncharacterized protein (DUF488 family)|nr:hypothetical protein [Segetibacter sp.]